VEHSSFTDSLFGPELIRTLQVLLTPSFNRLFEIVTLFGNEGVLVALTAIVYWCFDKKRGRLVTYILFWGAYLNFYLKILIRSPRPPIQLRIVEQNETSYGFPSGNTQDATTFWGWVSLDFKNRSLAAVGAVIVLAVAISRIYLGVHYPIQVIGGIIVGLVVVGVAEVVVRHTSININEIRLTRQILFAIFALVPLVASAWLGWWGGGNPSEIGGYLFAFSIGVIVEDKWIRFTTAASLYQKVVRVVIGGFILGGLTIALGPFLPLTNFSLGFVNSAIHGLAVVLVVPFIFQKLE